MVVAVLFVGSISLLAQPVPISNGGKADKEANQAIIEGCLGKHGIQYTLTDATGTVQNVEGKNLKNYLGHHVQLSGEATSRTTGTTQVGGASSVHMEPYFRVMSIKDLGKECGDAAEK